MLTRNLRRAATQTLRPAIHQRSKATRPNLKRHIFSLFPIREPHNVGMICGCFHGVEEPAPVRHYPGPAATGKHLTQKFERLPARHLSHLFCSCTPRQSDLWVRPNNTDRQKMKRCSLRPWFWASIVSVPLGLWAAVTFIYCAWLTATPLTEERLRFVQLEALIWLLVTVACFVVCGVTLMRWIFRLREDRSGAQPTS